MNLLRRVPALLLAVTLALAVGIVPAPALLLAAPAAQAGEPALLDYYEGVMVIDGEDVTVGLLLYDDGTAEVISDFESEDGSIVQVTEVGTWVDNGDGTISLTVTGTTEGDYAAPVSIDFEIADDGSLFSAQFGADGLTLLPDTLGNSEAILAQIPADAQVYQSDVLESDTGPGLQLTLAIFDDGSLTLVSDYMSEGDIVVEFGTWSEAEDGSLLVTLTGQIEDADGATTEYEEPLEFVFTVNDDGSLSLVDEGGALFGDEGLTLFPTTGTGEAPEGAAAEEETVEATPEAAEEATPEATEEEAAPEETPEAAEETTGEPTTDETTIDETTTDEEVTGEEATGEEVADEEAIEAIAVGETAVITPSGVYISELLPSQDGTGTFLVTIFYEDGNILFSTYQLNGDPPITEVGVWSGSGEVGFVITATGTLDEEYDEPVVVDFTIDEEGVIRISGVPLYPLEDINLAGAPSLVAEFQSDLITDTVDLTHTLTLRVYDDFSAELITTYVEEDEIYTEYGEWDIDEATDQLIVTLTSDDEVEFEEPVEWIFEVTAEDTLVLANDDEGYYGEDGLTLFAVIEEAAGGETTEDADTAAGDEATDEAAADETTTDDTTGDTATDDTTGDDTTGDDTTGDADAATLEGLQLFQSDVLPVEDSPGLQLTLGLADDGSAVLDFDYLTGEAVETNLGEWVENEDGTITLSLIEGPEGTLDAPIELTLELDSQGNLVIIDAGDESVDLLGVVLAPVVLE